MRVRSGKDSRAARRRAWAPSVQLRAWRSRAQPNSSAAWRVRCDSEAERRRWLAGLAEAKAAVTPRRTLTEGLNDPDLQPIAPLPFADEDEGADEGG